MQDKETRLKGLHDSRCIDLTGQTFGFLTVVKISDARVENRVTWECKCICGNIKLLTSNHLKRGRYKSCGCKHRAPGVFNPNWKGYGELSKSQWRRYLTHAKEIKVPFKLTIEEMWHLFLKQNRTCALSGLALTFSTKRNGTDGNASLDRIDSSKGYIVGNVQWIDKRFNWMKKDYPVKEFIQLCTLVSDYNKQTYVPTN